MLNILKFIGKNIFEFNRDPRPIMQNTLYSDIEFSELSASNLGSLTFLGIDQNFANENFQFIGTIIVCLI